MMAADTRAPDRSPRFKVTSNWIDLTGTGEMQASFWIPWSRDSCGNRPFTRRASRSRSSDEGLGNFS
jgi:hypothetical protein